MTFHVCAADLGLRSDGTGACVLRVDEHVEGNVITLVGHYERRPTEGKPLSPSIVCVDVAHLARHFDCTSVWSDLHYVEAFRERLQPLGLTLLEAPAGASGKADVWTTCRAEILEGRVRVPRVWPLLAQLKLVRSRPTSGGGLSIEQPRRQGTHGDLASAFALAVWAAVRGGGGFTFDRSFDRLLPKMRMSALSDNARLASSLRLDDAFGYGVRGAEDDNNHAVEDYDDPTATRETL